MAREHPELATLIRRHRAVTDFNKEQTMDGVDEQNSFPVVVDLRHLTHATRALQFALGTGQILTTRKAAEQAQWDARHVLERLVMQFGLEEEGGALQAGLSPWLRHEVAEVLNHATDRLVRAAVRSPIEAQHATPHPLTCPFCGVVGCFRIHDWNSRG
jgi:hypothetical protein